MPYFDYNATTPLAPAAREAWLAASQEAWHNPSSLYRAGARVKVRLDAARGQLAQLLDTRPERLVFTGGATEAAAAILAHLARTLSGAAAIAVNPTEHPCVLEAARAAFEEARIRWLPVDAAGVVTADSVRRTVAGEPGAVGAVVVMAANNETGVLQPWGEIARVCRDAGVPFVCDASQWLGKLPANGFGGVDWLFGAAHKFGGPKGAGFLQRPALAEDFVIRRGGGQERGQRGGTEDYPAIAAMVAALRDAEETKVLHETERAGWRDAFERELRAALPGVDMVGAGAERLWNTSCLVMPHGENHRWLARLDRRGCDVSAGSACATGKKASSHVLVALGRPVEQARRLIRASAGWDTVPADWTALRGALVEVAPEVRPSDVVVSV